MWLCILGCKQFENTFANTQWIKMKQMLIVLTASSWAGNLRTHLKVHSEEWPNKCNQCNYASFHAGKLRKQLKIHSAQCVHCTVGFSCCQKPLQLLRGNKYFSRCNLVKDTAINLILNSIAIAIGHFAGWINKWKVCFGGLLTFFRWNIQSKWTAKLKVLKLERGQ